MTAPEGDDWISVIRDASATVGFAIERGVWKAAIPLLESAWRDGTRLPTGPVAGLEKAFPDDLSALDGVPQIAQITAFFGWSYTRDVNVPASIRFLWPAISFIDESREAAKKDADTSALEFFARVEYNMLAYALKYDSRDRAVRLVQERICSCLMDRATAYAADDRMDRAVEVWKEAIDLATLVGDDRARTAAQRFLDQNA